MGILDREGLDALSMRRVAQELGTGAASLYAHVARKGELLELLFDEVVGEIPVPVPDPERWQEQILQVYRDARAAFARHGDVARVAQGNIPLGPNALVLSEAQLAIMRSGGVPDQMAAWTVDVLGL